MKRSLNGLCVLNTRPAGQAQSLSKSIKESGGEVFELPTLEIQALDNWVYNLPDLTKIDQAIFISANAVEHCFKQLEAHQIDWPLTIKTIAIGKSSATALEKFNQPVSFIPEVADSEHLLELKTLLHLDKQKILLFKGQGGRPLIEESLLLRGANLITIDVYQRIMPKINPQFIKSIWHNDLVDIILLTSEQSMHNLFKLFEEESHNWLYSKACLVISERLAQIARSLKIKNIILSSPEGIMNTLFDYTLNK